MNALTCDRCKSGTFCPGGNVIIVSAGYWRKNNTTDIVSKCPYAPQNCMGGSSNFDNITCSEGHTGAYCEVCDIEAKYWNESYSNAGGYQCSKCS